MNHHRSLVVLAAATLLACRAGGAPQAQAAEKPAATAVPAESKPSAPPAAIPKIADPRTEALVGWLESFFPWGAGEVTADALDSVRIPGWRLYRAAKKFAADERANDQAFVLADDAGKTALVGDVFVDEARLKAPKAIRGEADLDTLRELLGKFLRGRFKVSFDPSLDRRSFKGLKIQHETGYGAYEISAYVASDDGALLLVGRAWDRGRGFAEQRKAMIKLDGAPSAGPADATVTIVEYSDMQCPFCKKRAGDLETLIHKLGKELMIQGRKELPDLREHLGVPGGVRGALLLREGQGFLLQLEGERPGPAGDALRRRARHLRSRLRRLQRHFRGGVPLLLPAGKLREESPRRPGRGVRGPGPVDADLLHRRRPALLVLRQPDGGVPPQDLPEGGGASAARTRRAGDTVRGQARPGEEVAFGRGAVDGTDRTGGEG
jgi:hypothetical protein